MDRRHHSNRDSWAALYRRGVGLDEHWKGQTMQALRADGFAQALSPGIPVSKLREAIQVIVCDRWFKNF
jgi:hypothetical protein